MKRQDFFIVFIGCLISVMFTWYVVSGIDWTDTWQTLKDTNALVVALIAVWLVSFFWMKAFRWSSILKPISEKSPEQVFPVMMVGVMANAGLSVVIGELIRTYLLGKRFHLSKSSILATVFLERLWDVLTLLFFLAVAIAISPLQYPVFRLILLFSILGIIFGTLLALVIFKGHYLQWSQKLLAWLPEKVQKAHLERIKSGIEGFEAITVPALVGRIALFSFFQWLIMAVAVYLAFKAVHIEAPFAAALFVMVINAFALVLPSSPGYIGVFELGFLIGLESFGASPSHALAASLVFHAIYLVMIAALGVPCWFLMGKKENG